MFVFKKQKMKKCLNKNNKKKNSAPSDLQRLTAALGLWPHVPQATALQELMDALGTAGRARRRSLRGGGRWLIQRKRLQDKNLENHYFPCNLGKLRVFLFFFLELFSMTDVADVKMGVWFGCRCWYQHGGFKRFSRVLLFVFS